MVLYRLACFAGAGLCLLVSAMIWLTSGIGQTVGPFEWVMISIFALAGVVLGLIPHVFLKDGVSDPSSHNPHSQGKRRDDVAARMAARRERVAAAEAAADTQEDKIADQQTTHLAEQAPSPEEANRSTEFHLGRWVAAGVFVTGLLAVYFIFAQAGDPVVIAKESPTITGLTLLIVVYASWRISRVVTKAFGATGDRETEVAKRKPYTTARMEARRAYLERAKRDRKT